MKQTRKYGLFFKVGKRWIRLYPKLSYTKETAIRMFQTRLLQLSFMGKEPALRPLSEPRSTLREAFSPTIEQRMATFAKMEDM